MSADPRFEGPGPDAVYAGHLAEGRFTIQHCGACGRHQFPPALLCRACGSPEVAFVEASGNGEIYSTTTVRARNVAIVELAEGPRMMSRVENADPDAVRIGDRVRARIASGNGGEDAQPFVVFDPAVGDAS